jgi:hypothetical protein
VRRRFHGCKSSFGLGVLDEPFLDELERRANDPARLDEEAQRASEQTQQAEARNEVGVYVYALPHYIRYPYD